MAIARLHRTIGVKVGSANKDQAEAAREAETIKVQELAARVDPHVAKAALDSAQRRMEVKATVRRH